jgi:hypothetical protein
MATIVSRFKSAPLAQSKISNVIGSGITLKVPLDRALPYHRVYLLGFPITETADFGTLRYQIEGKLSLLDNLSGRSVFPDYIGCILSVRKNILVAQSHENFIVV